VTVVDTASILCLIIVNTTVCLYSSSEKHQDLLRFSAVMISQSDTFDPIRDCKQFYFFACNKLSILFLA
jgi:hypothetical protein